MGKSRKSTIRKFEFYETITDNGIESGYVRLANTQFHSDAVMDLSANSYRVFTYMKFRAKGNKVFTYTSSGAFDYNPAIRRAVDDQADRMAYVTYGPYLLGKLTNRCAAVGVSPQPVGN